MKIKNRLNRFAGSSLVLISAALLYACGASNPPVPSDGHIKAEAEDDSAGIPQPVTRVPVLPRPGKRQKLETYTVVVHDVPVRELLFSMARDASLNLDIDNDISGTITMNAIDQTLPRILDRIESQSNIVYSLDGDTLKIRADKPYLQTYNVGYLNMQRSSEGTVSVSTEIGSTGTGIQRSGGSSGSGGGRSGGRAGNKAKSEIENKSDNDFWLTLTRNIGGILDEEVKITSGSEQQQTSNNIIVNRESGIIAVRATAKQHRQIRRFIEQTVGNVRRQVLIEATIAEVRLSDNYQAGIDWSVISETATVGGQTVLKKGGIQDLIGGSLSSSPFFQLATSGTVNGNALNITLKALETFGDVKVLSSPKVMALNNQTAILKVVDNEVYFTTDVEVNSGSVNQNSTVVVDTTVNTIPIGIVMAVTPYINEEKEVLLNVRPTISRIVRFVRDPNPLLAENNVESQIPVVQVREIETMLKIKNRETAVIGGLMQDQIKKNSRGVPILSSIPLLGRLFSFDEEEYVKSELVIFIRPVVVEHASLNGDLADYKQYLMEDLRRQTGEKLSSSGGEAAETAPDDAGTDTAE